MAVRIPIITVFDSKGLKQAQYQLNKVRGNFQALGRNAAIAGVAIGAVAVGLGKSVAAAAEAQKVMTQTDAVLKSTGTTANGTAADIANLSEALSRQTAVDDELIQSGANLLLTFKNIQNQAGANNDIFDQTVAATLDVARAMGTDASGEAIRLGKALNDPVKGISALTRVGIQFTDQQKAQIKALTESGDLLGAQKIILAELQSQFGGSAQAYAQTFAGQIELLGIELENLSEEIGVAVMPALMEMITAFRELAPEIGSKLKAALASVDLKAFAKTISDVLIFLVQNAEAIMKVVTAIYLLNTAYNLGKVAVGLYNAAAVILNATFGATTGAVGLATGALKLFKIALITSGIGAFVVALGFIIQGATEVDSSYRKTTPVVTSFGTAVLNSGKDAEWAAGKYGVATDAINKLNSAVSVAPLPRRSASDIAGSFGGSSFNAKVAAFTPSIDTPNPTGGTTAPSRTTFNQSLTKGIVEQNRTNKLIGLNLSEGAAQLALSTVQNKKQFTKLITNLSKPGKAAAAQTRFNKTAAGIAEVQQIQAQIDADNAASAAQARADAEEAQRQRDAIIAAEKAAAEERERIYKSFADSVTSTFGSIKDAIVGAFSLPELGGSTNSIIRNMDKLLSRVKSFSTNISQLSSMGLNPTLLAQVIQAGPVAGARLAAGLVAGGAEGLARINAGFGEIQTLGSEIGMTGTQSRFGTSQQQQIININIEGGLDSSAAIGKAVVDAVRAYERTSGAVWQGA